MEGQDHNQDPRYGGIPRSFVYSSCGSGNPGNPIVATLIQLKMQVDFIDQYLSLTRPGKLLIKYSCSCSVIIN